MSEVEKSVQRAIDKTPVRQFPRTAWGLVAMLASEGLEVVQKKPQ